MAKAPKKSAEVKEVISTSKRAGYKRNSNKRVDRLFAQLKRTERKALNKAMYVPRKIRFATAESEAAAE